MKSIIILTTSILLLSCNQSSHNNKNEALAIVASTKTESELSQNLDWLIGNWKRRNEESGKETFENWKKINPNNYSGIGFTIQKGDTISQEKMDIIASNGKWTLIVTLPNKKDATQFEITELNNNEFVCINDANDFPKKIQYWLDGEIIKAKISNDNMEILFEFEKFSNK